MSVHWPIIRTLVRNATRTLIFDDQGSYQGKDILIAAMHVASEIERCSASSTVGLLLPTSATFPIAAIASWMLGRTVVPLNYLLKPEELAYVIDHCQTDCIVTVNPILEHIDIKPAGVHLIKMDELNYRTIPDLRWPAMAGDDALAMLIYTSGTTGRPKGVMLTHGNLSANIRQGVGGMDVTKNDVFLGVLPQFHAFGVTQLTLTPLTVGAKVLYTARFRASTILKLAREHGATAFVGIPSMYNALIAAKQGKPEDLATMRLMVSGAEPLPDATLTRFRDKFNITICEGYGMTEMSPATNLAMPDTNKLHSVGRPLAGVEQRIVDPATEQELSVCSEGELRMKGPNLMAGYFRNPEATRAALDSLGYLKTGDMAKIDEDGYLFITGRIKEMIIVGGENVFPREVEEVLNKHEAVASSGVIGVQDPMRGEVIVAFVELLEDQAITGDELRTWCRQFLAGYKAPREVHIIDALPRNPIGKIIRRDLKALLPEKERVS